MNDVNSPCHKVVFECNFIEFWCLGTVRAHAWDMSALGVAIAAGNAVGVWSLESWRRHATAADTFLPTTTDDGKTMTISILCLCLYMPMSIYVCICICLFYVYVYLCLYMSILCLYLSMPICVWLCLCLYVYDYVYTYYSLHMYYLPILILRLKV